MGVQNPQTISLSLNKNPLTKVLSSRYQVPPAWTVWPAQYVNPLILPMQKVAPVEDSGTPSFSYHKNSFPGVAWACPVRVMFGSGPRFWVLRQGPAGMTIGNGSYDGAGKFIYGDDAGVLNWPNPVAGTHSIVVDVFDQTGQVTFRWEHTCGPLAHLFVGVAGTGDQSGTSPSDLMPFSSAYLGDTTLSPSKDKTLHLAGGDYSAVIFQMFPAYHSRNIVRLAGSSAPRFQCRFNDQGSYRFISGLEWHDVEIGNGGLIHTDASVHNLISWRNRFIRIKHLVDGSTDNEACHTTYGSGGLFRRNYVVSQNYYEDVEVAATDLFSVENFLCERETGVVTDPLYTTRGVNPFWYAKAGVRYAEFSNLHYDNPAVNGGSSGIIHVQHGATYGDFGRTIVENNFIRLSGGAAIRVNTSANNMPIDAIAYVHRNSVAGGYMQALDWDNNPGQSRSAVISNNAYEGPRSATQGMTADSVSYTLTGGEVSAASGVFDALGNLTPSFAAYLYLRGSTMGVPV